MTGPPRDQLHYHVTAKNSPLTWTVATPAEARQLRRDLLSPIIARKTVHIYECSSTDPDCPLTSDRRDTRPPRRNDARPDPEH
jgi:hypothetical protein